MAIRQSLVIDAQLMQERRVQVVNMHWIARDVVSEIIGFTVHIPPAHAAAGHPHGEASGMVVAAEIIWLNGPLAVRGSPKFTAPYH